MPTAAIYTRQSLDKTGDEAGVARQLKECRTKAGTVEDLVVVFELSDNDISATTGKVRPGFEKLLKLIEAGTIDTVVVWHTDRLYRKLRDLVRITDIAEKHPVTVVTVKAGDLDLNSATGRMVAGILGSVSSQEGEHRTDRQKLAYEEYAAAGEWKFSHRPFGYERGPARKVGGKVRAGKVIQVPTEALIVREAFMRYADGESHHAIVKDLNARGILTAPGNPWTITQLRTVLQNERYAGVSFYQGQEVGTGDWEPIITREEWNAYVGAASRRKTVSNFSTKATSLLSGLITCAVCQKKVYRKHRGDRIGTFEYRCYEGHHVSIETKIADEYVRAQVISALVMGPRNTLPTKGDGEGLDSLTRAMESLQERADDLVALVGEGHSTMAKQRPVLDRIKQNIEVLKARRDDLLASSAAAAVLDGIQASVFKNGRASFKNAARLQDQVAARFDALPLARQRELVSLLLTLSLGRGQGIERLRVTHEVALGLNADDEGEGQLDGPYETVVNVASTSIG
jgi:site-specific DNA recombinase